MMFWRETILARNLTWRWVIETVQAPLDQSQRMGASRQFAIDAARLLADTRCNHICVLDVSAISPVTDFLVIATGTSPRQLKTACDDLEEMALPRDFRALSRAGDGGANWNCIDFVDIVVHVFSQDARMFYDLDALWGDGQKVPWEGDDAR
jgi:ribosome-associated protein